MASREPSSGIFALNRNIRFPEKINPDLIIAQLDFRGHARRVIPGRGTFFNLSEI
jgi:hypothetical protein